MAFRWNPERHGGRSLQGYRRIVSLTVHELNHAASAFGFTGNARRAAQVDATGKFRIEEHRVGVVAVPVGEGDDRKIGDFARLQAAGPIGAPQGLGPGKRGQPRRTARTGTLGCSAARNRISARTLRSGDEARLSVPRATPAPAASIFSSGYRSWPK